VPGKYVQPKVNCSPTTEPVPNVAQSQP
jgi:hypothetical protein